MNDKNFPDIPLGLGMSMAKRPEALRCFGHLTPEQQINVIKYVQSAQTGEMAKSRIEDSVSMLEKGDMSKFQ